MLSTSRNTIRGSCMAHHSEFGPAGIRIRGFISPEQESPLAWDSAWVSLGALAGDGATGDSTGITGRSCSTTQGTSLIAERLRIATISAVDSVVRIELLDSMAVHLRGRSREHNMVPPRRTARPVCVPGRSAVLTMEAPPWRAPPVDDRASAEGPVGAGDPMAGEVEGSLPFLLLKDPTNYTYGGNTHAQRK
jgi:hypothetical protein